MTSTAKPPIAASTSARRHPALEGCRAAAVGGFAVEERHGR